MADTGFVAVSSAVSGGSGTTAWTNPTNVYSSDNNYATVTLASLGTSKRIICNLAGLTNVPTGATVVGVEASVECKTSANTLTSSFQITLMDDMSADIGSAIYAATAFSTTEGTILAGGSTNLFGYATWEAAVAAGAVSLGLYLSCARNKAATFSVDQIMFKWYYTSSSIKMVNGLAKASVKVVNGLAIASVKGIDGLT